MRFDTRFRSRRSNVFATRGMVATSHPLAANAGLDVLKAGGNAADAAVTTAAVLSVVDPLDTGVGGDCFALYWDASAKEVTALNGSGRAPAGASIDDLRRLGYESMPRLTGHTVTVPGTVAGWADLLARHGTISLADALQPAIWTAENGFVVTEWVADFWATLVPKLLRRPEWKSGDLDNGPEQPSGHEFLLDERPPRAGELMRLPELGETMRGIAAEGVDYIYRGEFARRLSEHIQRYGGWMTPADMAAHESTWDAPITTEYRGVTLYECPPNGQGLAAIIALNLAAGFDLATMNATDRVHILVECMRLAFADARHWVADPRVVDLPVETLTSPAYAGRRRKRISNEAAQEVPHGHPMAGSDTVYLTVVDGDGNACSFINSLYRGAGTGLIVPGTGVALQNRGELFVLDSDRPNALAPNKRPYHTIIPAMTTCNGQLHASFGVMGGYMQPQGHVQVLVNMCDLDMSPQMALDSPRWMLAGPDEPLGADGAGGRLYIEQGWAFDVLAELARRGHRLVPVDGFGRSRFGGGQIIVRNSNTGILSAGSDPRKDGCAMGW